MKTKNIIIGLLVVISLLTFTQTTTPVSAVEVEPSQTYGLEPSSGFVDEHGNPISIEEYNKIREHESKNIIAREPLASSIVIGGIAGGIGGFVAMKIRRKKKTAIQGITTPTADSLPPQPPTPQPPTQSPPTPQNP